MSAVVIGRNRTLSPDVKEPQVIFPSCGSSMERAFILVSLSIANLPCGELCFHEQDFEKLIIEVVRETGNSLAERDHGRKFRRKGTDTR